MYSDTQQKQRSSQQLAFTDDVDMMDDPGAATQRDLTNDSTMMDDVSQITDPRTLIRRQWRKRKQKIPRKNRTLSDHADNFLQ